MHRSRACQSNNSVGYGQTGGRAEGGTKELSCSCSHFRPLSYATTGHREGSFKAAQASHKQADLPARTRGPDTLRAQGLHSGSRTERPCAGAEYSSSRVAFSCYGITGCWGARACRCYTAQQRHAAFTSPCVVCRPCVRRGHIGLAVVTFWVVQWPPMVPFCEQGGVGCASTPCYLIAEQAHGAMMEECAVPKSCNENGCHAHAGTILDGV